MKNITLIIPLLLSVFSFGQESHKKDEFRNKGYFNITRFSYINTNVVERETFTPESGIVVTDLSAENSRAFTLQTINGYFISPYFSLGVGFGLDGYHNPDINTMPLFLDVRAYLNNNYDSPFIALDLGTLVKIEPELRQGRTFQASAGYKLFIEREKRIALIADIGYTYKSISFDGNSIRNSEDFYQLNGLSLSLGIIF